MKKEGEEVSHILGRARTCVALDVSIIFKKCAQKVICNKWADPQSN